MKLAKSLKELNPKDVHLCLSVKKFIIDDLHIDIGNKNIIVAVSGGGDSIALLLIMNVLKQNMKFKIVVAHLDHGLRESSKNEMKFVKKLCEENKIPCYCGHARVSVYAEVRKIGIEEAARIIRYRFLEGVRKKLGADFICTAHHLNDLAEDVLMRLTRGVGWPYLGGMDGVNLKKRILRPLLIIPKNRLLSLLKNYSIDWVEDESNYSLRFKRNRIRHRIVPLFMEENPNFLSSIKKLWKLSRIDKDYFDEEIKRLRLREIKSNGYIIIKREYLILLPRAMRLRWYRDILNRFKYNTSLYSNLFNLDDCIVNFKGPRLIQFPGNKKVKVDKDLVLFVCE